MDIYHYLRQGRVVNIFYVKDKTHLNYLLKDYLLYGTQSLQRQYIKPRWCLCEYRVYKTLLFLDQIRQQKQNYTYHVLSQLLDRKEFPCIDYLVDYIYEACTLEYVQCAEIDFSTHFIKRYRYTEYSCKKIQEKDHCYFVKSPLESRVQIIQKKSGVYPPTSLASQHIYKILQVYYYTINSNTYCVASLLSLERPLYIVDVWLDPSCPWVRQGVFDATGKRRLYNNSFGFVDTRGDSPRFCTFSPTNMVQLKKPINKNNGHRTSTTS